MQTSDYISLEEQYGAHNYHPLDVVLERGEGVWLYDVAGHKYMDCLSAYSAVNQGHCHPRLVQAMIEQAQRLTLTSRAFRNNKLGQLYQTLHKLTGYDLTLPMNSGAEAVETALKTARKWGYQVKKVAPDQAEIIVCEGNFHGRTIAIVGFSAEAQYRADFGPFPAGFKLIPYGNAAALEAAITPNTVAFLVEPLQGEAGVIVPPAGYLKKVRQICDRHNILFMADEIQTGLGRTGKLFACDYEAVRPDVMIIGKALAGGFYPVSAVLASQEVLGLFRPGDHGSTFGGNPLGAAVAIEALAVLIEESLIENAQELGEYFQERLAEIPSPHVKEVRGKGLLIGVELKPEAGGARRFCEGLQQRGILCKETHQHVIRFAPPLVIKREEIDWALGHITEVLTMKL
jgi:ornithine--oxo-acid transaminase